ncbi:unnamed protein product [Pieris macdunnoughi]|uniref:Uncharacterized protein n=1 Tax=Pieris macdunnoughi TaxID=345717 RepID=A0A821XAJ1_9NEOP|nr:unnamed protein product [Pieris macdunnoughi]
MCEYLAQTRRRLLEQGVLTSPFDRADASQHPHLKDIAPWHSRPPDKYRYPRELFSADTPTTGRDTRAATAATTAGRLAGPPPRGHRGSHPAELDREPRSCPIPTIETPGPSREYSLAPNHRT